MRITKKQGIRFFKEIEISNASLELSNVWLA